MAYATSLEGQVTTNMTVFATSSFKAHALISTVSVIQGVVLCMLWQGARELKTWLTQDSNR